ncbi:YdiY family protein [Sulfitobacter aestuarii]|uniref:YdiY family protein n=1 Tax=Sulfitobacter aestuarii TaxID=2161676 RepID=A0ABW5U1I8_9RHOB
MDSLVKYAAASALALLVAAPVSAQNTITGITDLNDQIDDITTEVERDQRRGQDAERFGPNGVAQGWRGSFALTASGTSGNTDTGELSGAGRLTYGIGSWNHLVGFAIEYGESNGIKNEEKFFGTYEASRYFTPEFYAFGLGRFQFDGLLTDNTGTILPGSETDAFLGFGPGYRVLNTPNHTWRVQAGPGARYFKDANGESDTEVGFIASSRYYYAFTDTVSFTNDTDILGSDVNTVLSNDAGVNFKMSDNLSTRVSYRTDYNTDPTPGLKSTDNTIGVSLVIGF